MINKEAFITGITDKSAELSLTKELRDQLLKYAGLLTTDDSINGALGDDPSLAGFLGHTALHGVPYGIGGSAIGAQLGKMHSKGKNKDRNSMIGGIAGGVLGQGYGMFNDARGLASNELKERSSNLIDSLKEDPDNQDLLDALDRTNKADWPNVYGIGNQN